VKVPSGQLLHPQPQMSDELYVSEAEIEDKDQPGDWATTRFEPIFDAADRVHACAWVRISCITQRNGVTNYNGIQWMQRTIGDDYVLDPHSWFPD
jgi:hypothetical protein